MAVYIGRFAPSPTGPLHYGSLVAALASYLDARRAEGSWLLRIEDLDPPRESASAPTEIIRQLQALGLRWDGEILYQSTRLSAYEKSLTRLQNNHYLYPCICTRKATPAVYPGTCRSRLFEDTNEPHAIRLKLDPKDLTISDRIFGEISWHAETDVGDFIVKRKDGLFAYQLAVVVDDIFQGVTTIVRGVDLLDSTPRQLALYMALDETAPSYLHIPMLVDASGEKLSKQSHAPPVQTDNPAKTLRSALADLGQDPQKQSSNVSEILRNAVSCWQPARIPKQMKLTAPPS